MKEGRRQREWLEITIEAEGLEEEAGLFLFEITGTGVKEEPGRVVGYYPGGEDPRPVMDAVAGFLADMGRGAATYARVEEEDWARAWRSLFKAGPVSPRLFIRPPGDPAEGPEGSKVIEIRPSRAFGTGIHPTTRMCLIALDRLMGETASPSVLDVGTGSGILAIAAALLGASEVVAIDVDPDALVVAGENVERNRVAGAIRLSAAPLYELTGEFSLVLANLTKETLIAEAGPLASRVGPGGRLVAAGILEGQADEVEAAFSSLGLTLTQTLSQDEWRTLVLGKI